MPFNTYLPISGKIEIIFLSPVFSFSPIDRGKKNHDRSVFTFLQPFEMQVLSLLSKRKSIPIGWCVWRLFFTGPNLQSKTASHSLSLLCSLLSFIHSGKAAFCLSCQERPLHISYGHAELKPWHFQDQSVLLLLSKRLITRQPFWRNSSSASPWVTLLCINHLCLNFPGSLSHRVAISGNEIFNVKAAPNNSLHAPGQSISAFSKRSTCRVFLWLLWPSCKWEI